MRLVDADALLLKKKNVYEPYDEVVRVADIEDAPTIKAKPEKCGRWQLYSYRHNPDSESLFSFVFDCSECGWEKTRTSMNDLLPRYCENCGAKMLFDC